VFPRCALFPRTPAASHEATFSRQRGTSSSYDRHTETPHHRYRRSSPPTNLSGTRHHGMNSMRHDLRATLDEVPSEATQASAAATKQQGSAAPVVCWKCSYPPAPGGKLRYCGRCAAIPYCSKQCVNAHWAEHTIVCASIITRRRTRQGTRSPRSAGGSQVRFRPGATRCFGRRCELVGGDAWIDERDIAAGVEAP